MERNNRPRLEDILAKAAAAVAPPERIGVVGTAEKHVYINNPGSYVGAWDQSLVPYTTEIADCLTSLDYQGVVYMTSAQSSKSALGLNFQVHHTITDPADFLALCPTMVVARDYSMRKVDKMYRDIPAMAAAVAGGRDKNRFDIRHVAGNMTVISWPTVANLSGKAVRVIHIQDLDRIPLDVGGEGGAFDLCMRRTTTFKRRGMVYAESTPSYDITDPKFKPKTPHQMPPAPGIVELYNRGDRRRWYWLCSGCGEAFQPALANMNWPKKGLPIERGEQATMNCPHCGTVYEEDDSKHSPGKHVMNKNGIWIKDMCSYDPKKQIITGEPLRSDIASFAMEGSAAAFSTWRSIVADLIRAQENFEETGDETPLKVVLNTSWGVPFLPKHLESLRTPDEMLENSNDIGKLIVPEGVAYLTASVDIQKARFVVQVHGHFPSGDMAVIDRFDIKKSYRLDEDGDKAPIRPGSYNDDWYILVKQVILAEYEMAGDRERYMSVKKVICDSNGHGATTANALKFYRWLNREPADPDLKKLTGWVEGLGHRFQLLRGSGSKVTARVQITYPDSQRKDRHSGARGDVPVAVLNVHVLKDTLNGLLDRKDEGGGRIIFPNWLPISFYEELCVEVKDPIKGWINPQGRRNESFDLLVYALAAQLLPGMNSEVVSWDNPPTWADPESPANPYVREVIDNETVEKPVDDAISDLDDLGDLLL